MAVATGQGIDRIAELLGDEAVEPPRARVQDDRPLAPAPAGAGLRRPRASRRATARTRCCATCRLMFDHGRLGGTGFMSVLPVDQGIEHSAGASFAPNPAYFDPANIVELAIEGGCNARRLDDRRARRGQPPLRAPDPVHREDQPQRAAHVPERVTTRRCSARCRRRSSWARSRVGATIYFGSEQSRRQIVEVERGVRGRARARARHGALVLPAQLGLQEGRRRLPRRGRPDRPGEPPRRHDRGRHHQAEAAREQRRLPGAERGRGHLRAHEQEGLLGPDERPPDRPHALPGRQLLHGPRAA